MSESSDEDSHYETDNEESEEEGEFEVFQAMAVFDQIIKAVSSGKRKKVSDVIDLLEGQSDSVLRHLFSAQSSSQHDEQSHYLLSLALRSSRLLMWVLQQAANYSEYLPLDINRPIHFRSDSDRKWLASPLWVAARLLKLGVVKVLLDHGANVNDVYEDASPLLACLMDTERLKEAACLRIAKTLMERGADVTYTNAKTGATPLMLAAKRHYPQLVDAILEQMRTAGHHDVIGHVMTRDKRGRTAAHYAAASNPYRTFDYSVASTLKLLHKHGADLNVRDNDGRDALMSPCQWLVHHVSPRTVWMRIFYLMNVFNMPLTTQWQTAELVGAEAALIEFQLRGTEDDDDSDDEEKEGEQKMEKDYVYVWKKALGLRRLLQPDAIPALPVAAIPCFFASYKEPESLSDLDGLRNKWTEALLHALQVRRHHLDNNSLAVYNAYYTYSFSLTSARLQFMSRVLALVSRPPVQQLASLQVTQPHLFAAWMNTLKKHAFKLATNMFDPLRPLPVPAEEWRCFMQLMQVSVDIIIFSDLPCFQVQLMEGLYVSTRGNWDRRREDDVQRVVNSLAVGHRYSISSGASTNTAAAFAVAEARMRSIFCQMLKAAVHNIYALNKTSHSCPPLYLSPDTAAFLIRAAKDGGISLDQPQQQGKIRVDGPLHRCAYYLKRAETPASRRAELKCTMEMLVNVGGVHWDATGAKGCNVVRLLNRATVARHVNLQCLSARVVRRHVADYELKLPGGLADFVSMH